MRKWYHTVPKVIAPAECAELVTYAQTHPAQEATVGHGGGRPASADPAVRVSTVRWLKRADPVLRNLFEIIAAETHRANAEWFGKDIRSFNHVQFTEYPPGAVYHWHQDCTKVPAENARTPYDRLLSVCLQLTPRNDYEGGEFRVNPSGAKQTVKEFWDAGDLVIFPSELWHKVAPVTEGTRHSLVTWWTGPRG